MSLTFEHLPETQKDYICVVKVSTEHWRDERGVYLKKNIRFLRRLCKGFNLLEEDTSQIGVENVIPRIINLDTVPDGIYSVVTTDEERDWETGYVDDYNYWLVKYTE